MALLRLVAARVAVAFGAASAGLFAGYVACAAFVSPLLGPGPSSQNVAAAVAVGLGVTGAVSSLAVRVDELVS